MTQIREALAKATPGPWRADDEHGLMPGSKPAWVVSQTDEGGEAYLGDLAYIPQDMGVPDDQSGPHEQADAELIVLLRNGVEALLDALDRAQAASEGVDLLIAQAERRGAVKALRDAAWWRPGASDKRWLTNRADAIENRSADL